jgi:hypothetical protein
VAGRIREDDIAEVREKAKIDEVVSDFVTLRPAGGGSYKGLCPFHDEKSPSFNVNPARQVFHCFGCQEGGDVFSFLMKIDGLGFSEAVERLADKYGVQLRREEGDARDERPRGPQRSRLVEANRVAQLFYADRRASGTRSRSPPVWSPSAARPTTGSGAGCSGRSATPAATRSASAPAGSSTTTRSRRSTSTPPRRRSTRRARSCTASTWPAATSPAR